MISVFSDILFRMTDQGIKKTPAEAVPSPATPEASAGTVISMSFIDALLLAPTAKEISPTGSVTLRVISVMKRKSSVPE